MSRALRAGNRSAGARLRRLLDDERFLGYLLLLPVAVVLLALLAFPLVSALVMSLQMRMIGFPAAPFVGLENYARLVHDPDYWNAVRNTFTFTVAAVVLKLALGLVAALALNRMFPARNIVRTIVLIPWALPTVVTVLVWAWMFNDMYGFFDYLLKALHLPAPRSWLGDPAFAMPSVIAVDVWRGFPFFALILLAGLQSVPAELYEAASVDGARRLAQFWHITRPGISTIAMVVTLLSAIWTFNDFTIVWVLTSGGPGNATTLLSIYSFKTAFFGQELGYGVAVSATLLPLLVGLILLLVRAVNRSEATT